MEDSYANYTIDPEALRVGLEALGFLATVAGIAACICSPIGGSAALVAGLSTAVGLCCDSLTAVSYLSEGDVQNAIESMREGIGGKYDYKILKWNQGKMLTGADTILTKEEREAVESLFQDIPVLAMEQVMEYKKDSLEVRPAQKIAETISNSINQLP